MQKLYTQIETLLNCPTVATELSRLFCEVLNWGAPPSMDSVPLQVGAPMNRTLTLHPVAQMAGLPVFRIDWHETRLPTLTARRAVQRALAPTYAEHLLCYVVCEEGQPQPPTAVAFTWARKRADGKTELRTLPYTVGAPARTTLERLA